MVVHSMQPNCKGAGTFVEVGSKAKVLPPSLKLAALVMSQLPFLLVPQQPRYNCNASSAEFIILWGKQYLQGDMNSALQFLLAP